MSARPLASASCPARRSTGWTRRWCGCVGPTHAELLELRHPALYRRGARRAPPGPRAVAHAPSLARLHVRLAEWAARRSRRCWCRRQAPASELGFIAFHGQTIWHEPPVVTWQLGEPAVLAERFGVRVVSNFRASDLAAGGQGAPLVPMADVLLFASPDAPARAAQPGRHGQPHLCAPPGARRWRPGLRHWAGGGRDRRRGRTGRPAALRPSRRAHRGPGRADESVVADLLSDAFLRRAAAQEHRPRAIRRCIRGDAPRPRARPPTGRDRGRAHRAKRRRGRGTMDATPVWRSSPPGAGAIIRGLMSRPRAPPGRGEADTRYAGSATCSSRVMPRRRWPSPSWAISPSHGQPGNVPAATGAAPLACLGDGDPRMTAASPSRPGPPDRSRAPRRRGRRFLRTRPPASRTRSTLARVASSCSAATVESVTPPHGRPASPRRPAPPHRVATSSVARVSRSPASPVSPAARPRLAPTRLPSCAGRGAVTAQEARAVGINWVFAPVGDLDVLPDNPIVQTRAFGGDPNRVASLVRTWIEGCQGAGALACAKHFPGHGRTAVDSHLALPVVADTAATLRRPISCRSPSRWRAGWRRS